MVSQSLLRFLVLCYSLLLLLAEDEKEYQGNSPRSFHCGELGDIQFPFTNKTNPKCGLPIRGCDDQNAAKEVQLANQTWYEIESIEGNNSIFVTDHNLRGLLSSRSCNAFSYYLNAILPPNSPILHFQIEMEHNISLLRCKNTSSRRINQYIKYTSCNGYDIYYPTQSPGTYTSSENACSTIHLPILPIGYNFTDLFKSFAAAIRILILLTDECRECYENGGQWQLHRGLFHCASSKGMQHENSESTLIHERFHV
ncbi:uncharacterized protein LOC133311215 [Gastrolobium bilobum]|uniref:uncharacterized protein LOC133311215 n=1 Tax=Gastrolobium bilobum TaxID=150636 RepID=UPI002AAF1A93|nr:uncharacterized protein LOC133311215 [Gastrolobium bilobum]